MPSNNSIDTHTHTQIRAYIRWSCIITGCLTGFGIFFSTFQIYVVTLYMYVIRKETTGVRGMIRNDIYKEYYCYYFYYYYYSARFIGGFYRRLGKFLRGTDRKSNR